MRGTSVLFSALTKRTKKVRVQILKDFPKLDFMKGEIVDVKPSLMNNVLHGYNGAKFILKDSDIDQSLLTKANEIKKTRQELIEKERQARILEAQKQLNKQKEISFFKNTEVSAKEKSSKKQEELKKPSNNSVIDKNLTLKDIKIPGLDL